MDYTVQGILQAKILLEQVTFLSPGDLANPGIEPRSPAFRMILYHLSQKGSPKENNPEYHWKDWCWSWSSNTLASDAKNWLIRKDSDAGKDWRQEEKGKTEDEMVGWYHGLYGHEFEQASGVDKGQASLASCSSWVCEESDTSEWLSNSNNWHLYGLWFY